MPVVPEPLQKVTSTFTPRLIMAPALPASPLIGLKKARSLAMEIFLPPKNDPLLDEQDYPNPYDVPTTRYFRTSILK
jgi:hypothetical protein